MCSPESCHGFACHILSSHFTPTGNPKFRKKMGKKRIEADCTPTEIWVCRPFLQLLHCNLSVQIWPCPSTLFNIPPKLASNRFWTDLFRKKKCHNFSLGFLTYLTKITISSTASKSDKPFLGVQAWRSSTAIRS